MASVLVSVTEPRPCQVIQRSGNEGVIAVRGEVRGQTSETVEARVVGPRGDTLAPWRAMPMVGAAFSGEIGDVPVGGPYAVEVRVTRGPRVLAARTIRGILVGDLWILAGQSNMDGCGKLINLEPPSRFVHCYYYDETWGIAKDPLCVLIDSIDPVHWPAEMADPNKRAAAAKQDRAFRDYGAGLGVRFGKDLYKATGVPVGLVMCSHGGTSMRQWDPALKDQGGKSLYGSMMRRVKACGGKVAGCLWYQGESDAFETFGETYRADTRRFIQSLRNDLGDPSLPFILVQLAAVFSNLGADDAKFTAAWNKVQADQLALEADLPNVAVAAAIDSTLSDIIHIDAVSQRRMGARMAKLARRLAFAHDVELGPRPARIEFVGAERRTIRVSFEHVNGALTPTRNIRGFLVEKDGAPLEISSCVRGSDGTSVVITLASPVPDGAVLWYGRGIMPVCNLADKGGFAAPVFGPLSAA